MSLKLLIDDGMQISLGTGIGKYSQYLYEALRGVMISTSI